MTTHATVFQRVLPTRSANLCQNCFVQPKFQNHPYCSKTCAAKAAKPELCNHCHKKPKFQSFEYCGKTCASLANQGRWAGQAPGQSKAPLKGPAYPKGNKRDASKQTTPTTRYDPTWVSNVGGFKPILQSGLAAPPDSIPSTQDYVPMFDEHGKIEGYMKLPVYDRVAQ